MRPSPTALGVRVQQATLDRVVTLPRPDRAWCRPLISLAGPFSEDRHCGYGADEFRSFWATTWSADLADAARYLGVGGDADAALRRARRLVHIHWDAIELVAQALLEREQLTGREIAELLKGDFA